VGSATQRFAILWLFMPQVVVSVGDWHMVVHADAASAGSYPQVVPVAQALLEQESPSCPGLTSQTETLAPALTGTQTVPA
jgi:hypothetical protein